MKRVRDRGPRGTAVVEVDYWRWIFAGLCPRSRRAVLTGGFLFAAFDPSCFAEEAAAARFRV